MKLRSKNIFSKNNLMVIILIFFNLSLIYQLVLETKKNFHLSEEIKIFKNRADNLDLINSKISFQFNSSNNFYLILLIPDASCHTCVERDIRIVNSLLDDQIRGLHVIHLGDKKNRKYLGLDKLVIEIPTLNYNQIFNNKISFNQPLFLLVRKDGVICDFLLESIQNPNAVELFLLKVKNFL